MPLLPGLGTFGDAFLNSYKTMHGMDIEDQAIDVKRKQALMEEMKMRQLMQEAQRKKEQELAEREAMSHMVKGLQDIPEDQIPRTQRGLIGSFRDPFAAAQAAKVLNEGTGGVLPASERFAVSNRQELGAWLRVHRARPDMVSAQAIADKAFESGIKPGELETLIPEITSKADIIKNFYNKVNDVTGQATGNVTIPGRPALPGVTPGPGEPGSMGIQKPAMAGLVNAAQAGAVSNAQAGGHVVGTGDARASTSPITGGTYGAGEAKQAGAIASAQETDLTKRKGEMQIELMQMDKLLKQAQYMDDDAKRAQILSQVTQNLTMAKLFAQTLDPADPLKQLFDQVNTNAARLAYRGSLPRPAISAPSPGAPASGIPLPGRAPTPPQPMGKIRVRRKKDGMMGTLDAQDFNPNLYERQ